MTQTAAAEKRVISSQDRFLEALGQSELRLVGYGPIVVGLRVTQDGRIDGLGLGWPISGTWTWQDNHFCRRLDWGGRDLGSDCHVVEAHGHTMRFIAKKGMGDFANFRLH